MSNMATVKFQQETVRAAEKKSEELAHRVGERLTGGMTASGYLAVWFLGLCLPGERRFD